MAKVSHEVFIVVDANGDCAVGTTADAARESFDDNVGGLADGEGFRMVRVTVSVPLPEIIDVTAEVEDDEPATASAT